MPKPRIFPPEPRKGLKKIPPTPEQVARIVTAKRPSPVGQLDKVDLALKIVPPRAVAERLTARAIRETRKLEVVVAEVLEREGKS